MKLKKYIIIIIIVSLLSMDILNLFTGIVTAVVEEIEKVEYYVHDDYIERVYPNTNVEDFKLYLGKDVKVYEDVTKEKEVTSRNNKNWYDCKCCR